MLQIISKWKQPIPVFLNSNPNALSYSLSLSANSASECKSSTQGYYMNL